MPDYPGFVGPSYTAKSKYSAVERCVNFYPEIVETSDETKDTVVLYPTPCTGYLSGHSRFPSPCRGMLELNGRLFAVNGNVFAEYFPADPGGTNSEFLQLGLVEDDGQPVTMIANGVITDAQQVMISSAGRGYIWSLGGVFTDLSTLPGFRAGLGAAFLNNYFISIIKDTNGFQISNFNTGEAWDSLDVAYAQGQSDTLVNLISDRGYLWLFGRRRSQVWYVSGAASFPFAQQPGAVMECGLAAAASLIQSDNTIFWLGASKQGGVVAYRANGFNPLRVSNHAVEEQWAQYSTVADCWTYSFVWQGHTFVRFIFPTADKGWTYDVAASSVYGMPVWHENTFTDINQNPRAPLERGYAYFQGTHVVGSGGVDGHPGTLYKFTDATFIEDNPTIIIRYSNDGGNTFGARRLLEVGKQGEYSKRCNDNLLGSGRDRVTWARCVDKGECQSSPTSAEGEFFITRDRVAPHLYAGNDLITYHQLELELQKAIGSANGEVDRFWAIVKAMIYFTVNAS